MSIVVGIVMKPFLQSQINNSIWKDLYIKQDFADILSDYDVTSIGIIPQGIHLDRANSDDIDLSNERDLTDKEKNHLISQISLCDGLILQGGLSSHKYEVFIADYAIKNNIPILGICAGFNNIAKAIGVQVKRDERLVGKHDIYSKCHSHSILLESDASILSQEELKDNTFFVNSIHSMILFRDSVISNSNIKIEALAKNILYSDKEVLTVEAFSITNTKFCLAVKWHPELLPDDKLTRFIFSKFVDACKN